ncbi:zinc finger domain-containing protein [Nonomuraea cavernae]|uniref:zinc finger domain-containing protein n=1 Tax=Nonomuraea cavernae TaxID=2045107 RepID=UPI003FD70DB9
MEAHDCPMTSCAAPAGSPCWTGRGKVAVQYHTARFRLVPACQGAQRPHPGPSQAGRGLDRAAPPGRGRRRAGNEAAIVAGGAV